MKLSEILKGINVLNSYEETDVLDVTQDSRLVKDGSLFVCVKGNTFDGHSVAKEMIEKGACAVITQKDLGLENQVIVSDTRQIFSSVCANFFGNPAEKLNLIGLTGTNGKNVKNPFCMG